MATDFFERQAAARRSTTRLIGLFALSVVIIVAVVFAATLVIAGVADADAGHPVDPKAAIWLAGAVAFGMLALIGVGTFYKTVALRVGGGRGVAEGLGGRRLVRDTTTDSAEKRLLNVVDEMAIASGTPSPPVFLLEDPSINAFAAGYTPSDAVIGVTRGCVERLSRDELQGVIAHEFSHILNGDMRLGVRMIGVLHGVLLLSLVGRLLLRALTHSGGAFRGRQSGKDSGGAAAVYVALLAASLALIVLGSLGSFLGGLVKAAVSRQREYLADASAVQFTRNPGGIAGALKRILTSTAGSRLSHPRAAEVSHMYFAQGVWEGLSALTASHPPLRDRILAVDPTWDGTLPDGAPPPPATVGAGVGFAAGTVSAEAEEVSTASVRAAVDQIGDPLREHQRYAAELLAAIPPSIREAAGEPRGAQAVVFGLILDRHEVVVERQRRVLETLIDRGLASLLFDRLAPSLRGIDDRLRLPLVDYALPSLAAMSPPQYRRFCEAFRSLAAADSKLSLFEWTLSQVLLRHLRPQFEPIPAPRPRHQTLHALGGACGVLLSALAHACGDESVAARGYAAGRDRLKEAPAEVLPRTACDLAALREALGELRDAVARQRGRVVAAAATVVCADGHVAVAEAELLRGIADLLDCPMPPLLPGQRVAS